MTDTEARALLRRLDEAWRDGGEASHSFEVLTQVLREARALLAQPAPEGAKPQGPLKQYIRWPYVGEDGKWHIGELDVESPRVTRFFLDGALMKIAPEDEDETANVDWERVYHPELYATPPAAPECDDDIHDELCDCNQARPHLSRAEAEAMVEAHCHAIREHGVHFTEETRVARDNARAALLRALTGEGT